MELVQENISAMSDEHSNWLSALVFYKDDLKIVKNRLTEIAGKNTAKEAAAEIEHFENQLKVQIENIDILRHEIKQNLKKAASQASESSAGYIDASLLEVHDRHKDSFETTEHIINEFRQDFNRFAAQWM